MSDRANLLGVVLAGGNGRRIGGSKATVAVSGAPLISYPVQAVRQALGNVAVVAKPDTELPPLPGVPIWVEPSQPCHPLTGIVHALSVARDRPVLICACDLPLVTPELVQEIAAADAGQSPAVIARVSGELQPLLGCYRPAALPRLAEALEHPGISLRRAVGRLEPMAHDVSDPRLLLNVNAPEDVLEAERLLADQPKVKS